MVIPKSPVCKYFLNNSCRFGNKCKFRHVFEEEDSYSSEDYYNPINKSGVSILQRSRQLDDSTSLRVFTGNSSSINQSRAIKDINALKNEIVECFKAAEKSGMWPLSAFGLGASYGNIQVFEDISPEELRFKAYFAKNAGNFQSYVSEVQLLLSSVTMLKKLFIKRDKQAELIMDEYFKPGCDTGSTSNYSPLSLNLESPNFSSILKGNSSDMEYQSSFNTNLFGQVPLFTETQPSNFGEGNTMSNSVQIPQTNIFSQVPSIDLQKSTDFGSSVATQSDLFKTNLFGQVGNIETTEKPFDTNLFKNSSNSFFTGTKAQIYSDFNSLTAEELEQFKATTFVYGKVPIKPPPLELCY